MILMSSFEHRSLAVAHSHDAKNLCREEKCGPASGAGYDHHRSHSSRSESQLSKRHDCIEGAAHLELACPAVRTSPGNHLVLDLIKDLCGNARDVLAHSSPPIITLNAGHTK